MSKEIYISTTPHETRLAIVEDEQLAEIYYERENEYTLAGSIYNGRVTRVLPGMQSSFVDIGLERDAFLYVTDFMEEQGDAADFESGDGARRQSSGQRDSSQGRAEGGRERSDRGRGRRSFGDRPAQPTEAAPAAESTISFDEPIAPPPTEGITDLEDESATGGSRRWRGRRGRRRGRGGREEATSTEQSAPAIPEGDEAEAGEADGTQEPGFMDGIYAEAEPAPDRSGSEYGVQPSRGRSRDRGRGRRGERDTAASEPMYDNSYAGYGDSREADATGGPSVLPGESIRKYRDPAEVAAEDAEAKRNAPAVSAVQVASRPGIEISGWDGGSVLPGETLGRHRRGNSGNRAAASVQTVPSQQEQQAPSAVPPAAALSAVAPEERISSSEPDRHEAESLTGKTEAAAVTDSNGVADPPEMHEPGAEEPTEFEPVEGASAALRTDLRQDLRRREQPSTTPAATEANEDAAVELPDPTTYDLHGSAAEPDVQQPAETAFSLYAAPPEFTTLQSSGEMTSMDVEAGDEQPYVHVPPPQDEVDPSDPVLFEAAVHDRDQVPQMEAVVPQQDEDDEDATSIGVHAYGDGDFHEEELDEELDGEDFEYQAAYTTLDEADGEYEEETLDGDSDSSFAAREPVAAAPDESEDDGETIRFTGGFTEEDFGGEPSDDEESDSATTATQTTNQRENSRRPSFGRDRRGNRTGGDRGRGGRRQSVQTMDLPAINDLLKPGQEVLVQIAKEPIAKKGARITSHIALPGRFLVFMPTVNHTGVSRKISSDEERRRLKSLLLAEKGEAQGGFIVRTAAAGATDEELRSDLRFLIQMWTDIKARSESSKSPALIYHDLNLVERILRDQVTDNFSAIWVDTEAEYERVLRFLQRFQPSLLRRVKLYTKETPMFEHFGVTGEIDKALKSKVWLKSGGSIVINQTEALVAIDINTGKYVGKTARLEDTILKTNLDAIPEIVRQIRLRDLGGIIVIDFIDMDERKNRAKVLQTLEDAMRVDRAPSKILPFNDFGLVIMTRKRVKQSLERTLCIPDPVTEGTGMIKSPITIANEIYVEMRKMYRHLEKTDVMLRVHPEVVKTLKANGGKRLQELEDMTHKTILVKSDPTLSPEAFDIH